MYKKHFGLTEYPFGLTPDTQFFCKLPSHQEALNVLLIALNSGEGFIKIIGNVGTGKTMLCRKLLNDLSAEFISAYIPNPHLSPEELRLAIAREFGLVSLDLDDNKNILPKINNYLISAAQQGKKPVIIIDEAQAMPIETLEALRLLTNLETEKQKLLQIVLFGQPELNSVLNNKSIRQLKQRITFSHTISLLSYQNLVDYIDHRINSAGTSYPIRFSKSARKAIYRASRGVPRVVNILTHKTMLAAYGKGDTEIAQTHVERAILDTEETRNRFFMHMIIKLLLLPLLICLIFIIWYKLNTSDSSNSPVKNENAITLESTEPFINPQRSS